MSPTVVAVAADALVAVAVITAAVVLLADGRVDSTAAVAIIGAGITLLTGSTKALIALYAPVPAHPPEDAAPEPKQG